MKRLCKVHYLQRSFKICVHNINRWIILTLPVRRLTFLLSQFCSWFKLFHYILHYLEFTQIKAVFQWDRGYKCYLVLMDNFVIYIFMVMFLLLNKPPPEAYKALLIMYMIDRNFVSLQQQQQQSFIETRLQFW